MPQHPHVDNDRLNSAGPQGGAGTPQPERTAMTTTTLPLNFDRYAYDDSYVDLYALARLLGVSLSKVGDLTGLPASTSYDPEARVAPAVQARLRDFIEILEILMLRVDTVDALLEAVARYRIATLGGYTIRRLFHAGRSRDVLRVLRPVAFPTRHSADSRFDVPVGA